MAITAKPTSYTVDTGHAKCPDHLYMLDDATGATTVADGVGSLDLTADSTGMWATDGSLGQILRFVSASSEKAVSGNTFSLTDSACLVVMAKSAAPVANQNPIAIGHNSVANSYVAIRNDEPSGHLYGSIRINGATGVAATYTGAVAFDNTWRMYAFKVNTSTGSDGQARISLDGSNWGLGTEITTHVFTDLASYLNRLGLGYLPAASPFGYFDGDILAAYVYKDDFATWDDAWILSLFESPWQFLSTASAATLTPNTSALSV